MTWNTILGYSRFNDGKHVEKSLGLFRHVVSDIEKGSQLINAIAPKMFDIVITPKGSKEPRVETIHKVRLAAEGYAAIDETSFINCVFIDQ